MPWLDAGRLLAGLDCADHGSVWDADLVINRQTQHSSYCDDQRLAIVWFCSLETDCSCGIDMPSQTSGSAAKHSRISVWGLCSLKHEIKHSTGTGVDLCLHCKPLFGSADTIAVTANKHWSPMWWSP